MLFIVWTPTYNPHASTTKQGRVQPPSLARSIPPKPVSDFKLSNSTPVPTPLDYGDGALGFQRPIVDVEQLPLTLVPFQATANKPLPIVTETIVGSFLVHPRHLIVKSLEKAPTFSCPIAGDRPAAKVRL